MRLIRNSANIKLSSSVSLKSLSMYYSSTVYTDSWLLSNSGQYFSFVFNFGGNACIFVSCFLSEVSEGCSHSQFTRVLSEAEEQTLPLKQCIFWLDFIVTNIEMALLGCWGLFLFPELVSTELLKIAWCCSFAC